MYSRIEDLLQSQPSSHLQDPETFSVLWSDGQSLAGVYVPIDDAKFILAEESSYNPMSQSEIGPRSYGENPFSTEAEQCLIDLRQMRFVTRDIDYTEGSIQGLVYALDALRYGGPLEPAGYQAFIVASVREMWELAEEHPEKWTTLSETSAARLGSLGFIGYSQSTT